MHFQRGSSFPGGQEDPAASRQQVEEEGLLVSWLPGAGPFPATTPAAADPAKPTKNQHLGQQQQQQQHVTVNSYECLQL